MELTIQLAVLFMGKQFLMGIVEYGKPIARRLFKQMRRGDLREEEDESVPPWLEVATPN